MKAATWFSSTQREKRTKAAETVVMATSVLKPALCPLPQKGAEPRSSPQHFLHAESHPELLSQALALPSLVAELLTSSLSSNIPIHSPTYPPNLHPAFLPAKTTSALFYSMNLILKLGFSKLILTVGLGGQ